jgi:hypothetical protein
MIDEDSIRQIFQNLEKIQESIKSSRLLNDGLDHLIRKLDSIEQTQGKILEEVNDMKEALYHPDDGIYSRIKMSETATNEKFLLIDRKMVDIKYSQEIFANEKNKNDIHINEKIEGIEDRISNLEEIKAIKKDVDEIIHWKNSVVKILLLVGIPMLTTTVKTFYEFIMSHIQIK